MKNEDRLFDIDFEAIRKKVLRPQRILHLVAIAVILGGIILIVWTVFTRPTSEPSPKVSMIISETAVSVRAQGGTAPGYVTRGMGGDDYLGKAVVAISYGTPIVTEFLEADLQDPNNWIAVTEKRPSENPQFLGQPSRDWWWRKVVQMAKDKDTTASISITTNVTEPVNRENPTIFEHDIFGCLLDSDAVKTIQRWGGNVGFRCIHAGTNTVVTP